ncbi:MAG: hypothetical protein WCQ95_03140 [Bacteroidota bacterium]
MKKIHFTIICLVILSSAAKAQTFTIDTITIAKKMLTADMDYKGKPLTLVKLEDICRPYEDANDEIYMAKRNSNPALLLTLVGAALIGYTGVKWAMGYTPQWYFAAGGAVLIGATIPLYIGSRNHSINAARIYNYETKHKSIPKP